MKFITSTTKRYPTACSRCSPRVHRPRDEMRQIAAVLHRSTQLGNCYHRFPQQSGSHSPRDACRNPGPPLHAQWLVVLAKYRESMPILISGYYRVIGSAESWVLFPLNDRTRWRPAATHQPCAPSPPVGPGQMAYKTRFADVWRNALPIAIVVRLTTRRSPANGA